MSKDPIFTTPSVLHGIASIANLSGRVNVKSSRTAEEADANAISSDWNAVGQDILGTINEYSTRQQ